MVSRISQQVLTLYGGDLEQLLFEMDSGSCQPSSHPLTMVRFISADGIVTTRLLSSGLNALFDAYLLTKDREISLAEIRIQREGLPEIYDTLKPYDFASPKSGLSANQSTSPTITSQSDIWSRLTSCIKGALLTKITGHEWNSWQISSTHDLKTATGHNTTGGEDFSKDNVLSFVFPRAVRTFSTSTVGRDRTDQAMDTSAHVMAIITGNCSFEDSDEIIGELQFSYVSGMLLGNLACMEQWAHIIKVVFKAYRLAMDFPTFFIKFIDAVHAQFIYDEEGIDGSIMDHDSALVDDLKMILTIFKSRLNELLLAKGNDLTPAENLVGKSFESLEAFLWKWDWDLRGNYVRSGKVWISRRVLNNSNYDRFNLKMESSSTLN